MNVVEDVGEARAIVRLSPHPVGVVPTMGFLHEGHLSLVRRARSENATVAVSIFVNPTQFGPSEDFATYPRDLHQDLALLRAEGVDLVFTPRPEALYPPGFDTYVCIGGVTERLEGAARPGHFRGVATVVAMLFNILAPDRCYFGQKDAQQVVVVRKLAAELHFPVEVIALPTVRDPDGLALSSRNVHLAPAERAAATVLARALETAERLHQAGERDAERIRQAMRTVLASEPAARPEYVSVADSCSLAELDTIDRPAVVSMAVRIGGVRLIDNTLLAD